MHNLLQRNHRQSSTMGFTLIELLVVIAIIGLLSSVVFASLNSARSKARDAKRIADFQQIRTALELFYDTHGRYPSSPGAPTWDQHWDYFAQCLETASDASCGFGLSSRPVFMSEVPQDPQDSPSGFSDADPTYYYAWPSGCGTGQSYRLAVRLENANNQSLAGDLDGSYYNNNGGCNDPYYCIGVGTCSGW